MASMWSSRVLLALGLCLFSAAAWAEPDVFGLGNGQHGALRVQRVDTTINVATPLTASVPAGGTVLSVGDTTGFGAGELVLVHQVFAEGTPPASGTPPPLEVAPTGAGRWELARVESVDASGLRLTAPLVSSFTAPGAQVVRVPEYTSVHVQLDSSLLAPPWDGSSGGVLAFLATGAVLNQGVISADGAGFRGGQHGAVSTRFTGCTELDQSWETGGSDKGEGLFSLPPFEHLHGYGALGNAGGGGNCRDAGGGGGGHGSAGGQGGHSATSDGARDVGGRGGAALRYEPLSRLMFGGGGGAGAGTSSTNGTSGGAGGGIIYFRARDLQGSQGFIRANGASAASATGGAGGGGAGGHITLRVEDRMDCTGIEARGGNGGANTDTTLRGPGGGGGGGVVLVQGATLVCAATVLPGVAGRTSAAEGTHGATPTDNEQPDAQGVVTSIHEPFSPPVVQWVLPADGESTSPRPRLQATTQGGAVVSLFLDDAPLGTLEAPADGRFTFDFTADLAPGPHQVRAYAERLGVRGATSDPRAFTVGPLTPLELDVGCGCGATSPTGSAVLGAAVLLLVRLRGRRRAR